MKIEPKTAKELFQYYHRMYHDLVNIYCQAKAHNPFAAYEEIAKAIYRAGVLVEFWHDIAVKFAQANYFQEE